MNQSDYRKLIYRALAAMPKAHRTEPGDPRWVVVAQTFIIGADTAKSLREEFQFAPNEREFR